MPLSFSMHLFRRFMLLPGEEKPPARVQERSVHCVPLQRTQSGCQDTEGIVDTWKQRTDGSASALHITSSSSVDPVLSLPSMP